MRILNSILDYTVTRNLDEKSEETQRTLKFLTRRLPESRADLAKAENNVNVYLMKKNMISAKPHEPNVNS